VLVGLPDGEGGWRYAGRVGSGLAGTAGEALALRLRPLTRSGSPFSDEVPSIDARGTTWVEPTVVVEVRTLELTGQHRLRQPAYLGVRTDLTPADLTEVDDA
jgi:bifunctional non-homologous end joining protein LigD